MKLWLLVLFLLLGFTSLAYGNTRADVFDIGLGIALIVIGSAAYIAYAAWRRRGS